MPPERIPGVQLVEKLNQVGAQYGVGRGMHLGDTILGIKGRIGYEAPAAEILLTAHRELEKLVLTKAQRQQKNQLADFYGMMLHEGHYFDPVMRDIEAFLDSSQQRVTGTVRIRLHKGTLFVLGCTSPYEDARGFARLHGLQEQLAYRAMKQASSSAQEKVRT